MILNSKKIPVIHGFVTDEQGDPLTGILVSVRSIDDNHDYITNDEGWFECTGLKSEQQYLLFTSSSDYMPAYYSESKQFMYWKMRPGFILHRIIAISPSKRI
ncbi:MAG: hypothetical protein OMM_12588 [Candidatus Magnetoglobus multicellularis str. Araruama]|uniref:Carboxypeptidase regulatory-like domain-containing protein n=1 Tax=Candidatus Magnetoglobus multicellularis str. Araruama TaxID=890399 RepID=A0A1V1NVM1_9BACT|nr:MAG: hypothetical protein OMM_12588 [Candidatus Magnetoglobus multicellularis str. Araruama]